MITQTPEAMLETSSSEKALSYRQLMVLLILVAVLTFVGLLWRTEIGCFVFLALTLLIARFWSPPKLRRLLMFYWMVLAIAIVVGVFLYRWLNTPDTIAAITNNMLLRFLIGATWSRVFWSAVAGLLVGICLAGGQLLITMYISSEWLLAMRETFGVTRRQALRLLASEVLNVNYPYHLVEDGEMTLVKPKGVLDQLGGPGVAVIKPYNAVVFERTGEITRIEGPGVFLTRIFEFPKHIIDLRPQWVSFEVGEVLTKDKMPLRVRCGIGYRIESREQTAERGENLRGAVEWRRFPGIISGEYPVYKRTIFKAAYGPAGDWQLTTQSTTITQLRKVVAEFDSQDIYRRDEEIQEPILTEIGRRTKEKVAEIAHYWGVHVGTVNIDTIEVSEAVREQVRGVQREDAGAPESLQPDSLATTISSSSLRKCSAFRQLVYFARLGQCRLFIGSGVSSEAGMPGVQALQDILGEVLREMGSPVPRGVRLPELATMLEKVAGRSHMIYTLQEIFRNALLQERPWEHGAYPLLPSLPQELVNVVYTSNWDDLLKRAFEEAGRAAREIRHPGELSLISQAENAIVKAHRDFQSPDGPIVSEADYAIARNDIQQGTAGTLWGHLGDQLAQFRIVFVGYGLGDSTLNLIRRAVELHTGAAWERRHFLVGPLSSEEAQAAERWAGVIPIVTVASDFFQTLVQELQE
jgi:regulator of protease activity HflC (stomatin/prohibitin superfamily)